MRAARLEMRHITKNFGGVHALRDVTLDRARGRGPRALRRERGGQEHADEDPRRRDHRLRRRDRPRRPARRGSPARATPRTPGIRIIYQELNLVPELSVAANIFLGRERTRGLGWLDDRAMEAEARRLFDRLGTPISPRARVGDLRIGDQQMVEIAKALAFDAAIVIMDEPTSALSDAEVARLFRVIDDLRKRGHDRPLHLAQDERGLHPGRPRDRAPRRPVRRHAPPRAETDARAGRPLDGRPRDRRAALRAAPDRRARRCSRSRTCRCPARPGAAGRRSADITFQRPRRRGRSASPACSAPGGPSCSKPSSAPARRRRPARSSSTASPVRFRHPGEAIAAGVALVTEDRKTLGLFDRDDRRREHHDPPPRRPDPRRPDRPPRRGAAPWPSRSSELAIKTAGGGAPITSLSGGNQQKCIIARWLLIEPKLLLLDEPTRGIDVGAKAEIYALIRRLAAQGMAIIMTSSELPELLTVSDRIIVLCEGRLTAELPRAEATEEAIMHAATQFLDRAKAS